MESRTKNKQSREAIGRMAKHALGADLSSSGNVIYEMKEGWFNATYGVTLADGREVVLKIAPPPGAEIMQYERAIMATEVATMRMVRANPAIPVPEIYAFDNTRTLCDAPYFFMQKLEGENLEHVKDSLPAATLADIRAQIGAIMRGINTISGSDFGYPGNPDLRTGNWREAFTRIVGSVFEDGETRNVDYGYSAAALHEVLQRHGSVLDEVRSPSLVHWDAWDLNFFVVDGKITGLLDFERALWGDPLMEAQFRPYFGASGADILRGYGKVCFTPNEEIRRLLYTWHLGLVMVTECAYRNYDTDDVFNKGRAILASTMKQLG